MITATTLLTAIAFAVAPQAESTTYDKATADHDGDHVPTIMESPDGDGDPTNDDTDLDGTPNYLDLDDDGDGLWTFPDEDVNGDGDPTNDDSDGDSIPDYLDNDDGQIWSDELLATTDDACICEDTDDPDEDFDLGVDDELVFESGSACSSLGMAGGALWLLLPSLIMTRRRA
jgi:hypothetical protein